MASLIEDYLSNHINTLTGVKYAETTIYTRCCFLQSLFKVFNINSLNDYQKNQDAILDYLKEKYKVKTTLKKRLDYIISFEKYYELDTVRSKVDRDDTKKLQEIVFKELPSRDELQNILTTNLNICNTRDKLVAKMFLSLLLCYEKIFRSDLCTVKIKNFDKTTDNYYDESSHEIRFNTVKKVTKPKGDIKITVKDEHISMIRDVIKGNKTDYLYDSLAANRPTAFCLYIARISTKYLGQKLTINDFRKINVRHFISEDMAFIIRKTAELDIKSKTDRLHSINTALNVYYKV